MDGQTREREREGQIERERERKRERERERERERTLCLTEKQMWTPETDRGVCKSNESISSAEL